MTPPVPADFGSARRSIEGATQWASIAEAIARYGGDPTEEQRRAAAALRAAADVLDPPTVAQPQLVLESPGVIAEYEAHFEQIREGVPSLVRDWLFGDGEGVSDHETVATLRLGADQRPVGNVTAGWLRRCAGITAP